MKLKCQFNFNKKNDLSLSWSFCYFIKLDIVPKQLLAIPSGCHYAISRASIEPSINLFTKVCNTLYNLFAKVYNTLYNLFAKVYNTEYNLLAKV